MEPVLRILSGSPYCPEEVLGLSGHWGRELPALTVGEMALPHPQLPSCGLALLCRPRCHEHSGLPSPQKNRAGIRVLSAEL